MASLNSLGCCGFSEHKSVFRSIRKGAVLVCACAEVSRSKIRKSICLLSPGKKQLSMLSEISNETSWIELICSSTSGALPAAQTHNISPGCHSYFTRKGGGGAESCFSLISKRNKQLNFENHAEDKRTLQTVWCVNLFY